MREIVNGSTHAQRDGRKEGLPGWEFFFFFFARDGERVKSWRWELVCKTCVVGKR